MQVSNLDHLLNASASEVLETMFFTGILGETKDLPVNPITTRLNFRGTPSGSFGLSLSLDSSRQIAAGFLAEDEQDVSQERVNEVICELTNMLCGSLLSKIESEGAFDLSHPELAPQPENPEYSRNFQVENGTLWVWLTLGETQ
jgi:CheY-specific phosphatase CheX